MRALLLVSACLASLGVLASAMRPVDASPDPYARLKVDPHLSAAPRTSDDAARIAVVVAPTIGFEQAERYEARSGGAATHFGGVGPDIFTHPSARMSAERRLDFVVGAELFRQIWVAAPSPESDSDGLGPLYSARACQRCHLQDGRGHPPVGPDDHPAAFVLRLATPAPQAEIDAAKAEMIGFFEPDQPVARPDPSYGAQLQQFALAGVPVEARVVIDYEEILIELAGGEVVSLRKPAYRLVDLGYGPLSPSVTLSPRVAPQMIGLGLLEAIPAADILAGADPEDENGDGVSGRPNVAWSSEFDRPMLGRFGYKAGAPTLRAQSAGAFVVDMGLSSPLRPMGAGDCTAAQIECRALPHGGSAGDGGYEVDEEALALVVFYSRNLAVPARRDLDAAEVLRGKALFYDAGCTACHRPKFVTHRLEDQPEQSFQLIWPYTDMLLHDMGEGLADGSIEGVATGAEWRTAPLWGIGLTEIVSGRAFFLHDGRARSLLEAILWHGGEAERARQAFAAMPKVDRDALIQFLRSL